MAVKDKKQLFSVQSIQMGMDPADGGVVIMVSGLSATSGWKDAELVPLEEELSADGILDLDFVGVPPAEVALKQLSPAHASLTWRGDVKRLVGVNVHSRSGWVIELLPGGVPGGGPTTLALGEEGPGPTTLALGEEGPPPTTLAVGEEGPPTTLALGEEGPPTTLAVGEEGPPTTLALGEEGPPTTLALGEEGPGPTTRALGEEGPPPTTLALGEEGPPTTFAFGEEGPWPKWPFGETSPWTDDPAATGWLDPSNPNPFGRR